MIDQLDKATLPLIKNPKGRPKTGKALSAAEKQKRYRAKKQETNNEIINKLNETIKTLKKQIRELKKVKK